MGIMDWTGTPAVHLSAPTAAVRGALFVMIYSSNVVPCTTSGGSASDNWAGEFNQAFYDIQLAEPDAGTLTYTVTCGSGSQTVTDTVNVEIVADAPQVTLTADKDRQVTGQPVTLTWSSNTSPCLLEGGLPGDGWAGTVGSAGSVTVTEQRADTVWYTVFCGTDPLIGYAITGVIYANIPAPTLTASSTEVTVGEQVTLTWASADGSTCLATGGIGLDGWFGDRPASGSFSMTMTTVGLGDYGLRCGESLDAVVQITVNPLSGVPDPPVPPNVTLSASSLFVTTGQTVQLTWRASDADSCTASGGASGDGWAGPVDKQGGSKNVSETMDGEYVYTVTCFAAGGINAQASQTVTMARGHVEPGKSSGGGSIGPIDIAFFLSLGLLGWWQRRRDPPH